MQGIKELLDKSLKRHGITMQVRAATVCKVWDKVSHKILPPEVAGETEVISFKDGTLKIAVPGSSFAQAVKLEEYQLLKEINKTFEKKIIERIKPVLVFDQY